MASKYKFKYQEARDKIIEALEQLAEDQKFTKVVIPIRPDVTSVIGAALCARAIGRENVYGIVVKEGDTKVQDDICFVLALNNITVNIDELCSKVPSVWGYFSNGLLPEDPCEQLVRERMKAFVYRIYTHSMDARLIGTRTLTDYTMGNILKEGIGDFELFSELTNTEVMQIGNSLKELPKQLLAKVDSALNDVSYETIDHFIRHDTQLDFDTWKKIMTIESKNFHKRLFPPPIYFPIKELT